MCIVVDQKSDVIKENEAIVKFRLLYPAIGSAVKSKLVCPSSSSQFEFPAAKEGTKMVRKLWQASDSEGS